MSGQVPIVPPRKDDNPHDINAAKKRLSDVTDRPFEVDKILAKNRARQEHEQEVVRQAERTIADSRNRARQRRNELLAKEVDAKIIAVQKAEQRAEKQRLKPSGADRPSS